MPIKSQNKTLVFEDEDATIEIRKSRSVKRKIIAVYFKSSIVLDTQKTVTEDCLPKVIKSLKPMTKYNSFIMTTYQFIVQTLHWRYDHYNTEIDRINSLKRDSCFQWLYGSLMWKWKGGGFEMNDLWVLETMSVL